MHGGDQQQTTLVLFPLPLSVCPSSAPGGAALRFIGYWGPARARASRGTMRTHSTQRTAHSAPHCGACTHWTADSPAAPVRRVRCYAARCRSAGGPTGTTGAAPSACAGRRMARVQRHSYNDSYTYTPYVPSRSSSSRSRVQRRAQWRVHQLPAASCRHAARLALFALARICILFFACLHLAIRFFLVLPPSTLKLTANGGGNANRVYLMNPKAQVHDQFSLIPRIAELLRQRMRSRRRTSRRADRGSYMYYAPALPIA
jgi:hypothetical protein